MTSAGNDLTPSGFSGYRFEGPNKEHPQFTGHPEFLDDQVFWLYHVSRSPLAWAYAADEAHEDVLQDPVYEACNEFDQRLLQAAEWTAFTVPLKSGSSLHIVYSQIEEDHVSADYHLSHPGDL
jgi:hypothetical protein